MSLLMRALEGAARDREQKTDQPATSDNAAEETGRELSIGSQSPGTPPQPPQDENAEHPTTTTREHAPRTARATLAASGAMGGIGRYSRARPLPVFIALAALLALTYGIYVYLQSVRPGPFNQPINLPATPAHALPPLPLPPSSEPSAPEPILSAPLLRAMSPEAPPPPAPTISLAAAATPPSKSPATPQSTEGTTPPETIVVSRGSAGAVVNAALVEAHAALHAGRFESAEHAYTQLARAEPRNIDALLGLASIAQLGGRTEDAARHYAAILELDPRHALAQSGLIGLLGRTDPLAAETRLKQLIAREPSAFLYFTLGNLYADQSLWAQAQHAYFQAHHLDPGNPDYAYNLAVGLEHLSQPRLALGFYRRAVDLASARGHANFNPALAQERIRSLAARVE